jgi:hypothetical protein
MLNWIPVKIKFNNGRMANSIFKRFKASLTSVTFFSTSVEMNVLGTFPFRMIAFYHHLFGHQAGVAVFLARQYDCYY